MKKKLILNFPVIFTLLLLLFLNWHNVESTQHSRKVLLVPENEKENKNDYRHAAENKDQTVCCFSQFQQTTGKRFITLTNVVLCK